ncbi:type II toxin-antitoxin system YafQ family toxin [Leuconostoc inhae]|mgnify:CR=1 FL=1|uniref:type II toxin-antitoxin system YafQ family toxin n=1 Tax=Leuconostoc inhae TaxID=178001 RepID=UPI001C7D4AFD|nr:type II toxin-antitoxin system YafQ family toxin [Leuconostoc inhae]
MKIKRTTQFKKGYKKAVKANKNINKFIEILTILVQQEPIPEKYKDHALSNNYNGERDLHIEPDWLLIYHYERDELVLTLTAMGSHSELF